MSAAPGRRSTTPVVRSRPSSGLAEVLDIILDRGLVVDAFARVSVVGIELLTLDARVVVASVDTYLRFAEAVDRLNLRAVKDSVGLDDLIGGGGGLTGVISSGLESTGETLTGEEEHDERE